MTRECTRCGKRKNLEKFKPNKSCSNGFERVCRRCTADSFAKYKLENPWIISGSKAKVRCNNKNSNKFRRYGGRGIRFNLKKDELKFIWNRDRADKMKWPTLDRIDNDGNYELSNCRFIEHSLNSLRGALTGAIKMCLPNNVILDLTRKIEKIEGSKRK